MDQIFQIDLESLDLQSRVQIVPFGREHFPEVPQGYLVAHGRCVKYGDPRVWRRSTECTRNQITRTLASTYVLCPCKLLIQYLGGPEYKSGSKGGEGQVACPMFK
jgi:hypothetical protein